MSKNNELVVQNEGYLNLSNLNIAGVMAEELFGLDGGFERIKIPSAGSTVFEIPGDDPSEPDAVKEFNAVILLHHPLHAYYQSKYTGGNQPPDCGSLDGVYGEGNPGGSCSKCRFNQFGSGDNKSKACKNRRRIYVLREGEIFPLLLSLPTGSLKEFSRYIKRTVAKYQQSNMVVTKFSLRKAFNAQGIAFSQAQFALGRPLTNEEFMLINKLSESVKEYSKNMSVDIDITMDSVDDLPFVNEETGEVIEPLK